MTELLPELASFPTYGVFDGELVALDSAGVPDFPLVCERMLMRRRNSPVVYVIFDVPWPRRRVPDASAVL